jgi:hypothetical protein
MATEFERLRTQVKKRVDKQKSFENEVPETSVNRPIEFLPQIIIESLMKSLDELGPEYLHKLDEFLEVLSTLATPLSDTVTFLFLQSLAKKDLDLLEMLTEVMKLQKGTEEVLRTIADIRNLVPQSILISLPPYLRSDEK